MGNTVANTIGNSIANTIGNSIHNSFWAHPPPPRHQARSRQGCSWLPGPRPEGPPLLPSAAHSEYNRQYNKQYNRQFNRSQTGPKQVPNRSQTGPKQVPTGPKQIPNRSQTGPKQVLNMIYKILVIKHMKNTIHPHDSAD